VPSSRFDHHLTKPIAPKPWSPSFNRWPGSHASTQVTLASPSTSAPDAAVRGIVRRHRPPRVWHCLAPLSVFPTSIWRIGLNLTGPFRAKFALGLHDPGATMADARICTSLG